MEKFNELNRCIQELNGLLRKEKESIERAFSGDFLEVANFSYEEVYNLFKKIEKQVEKLEWRI